MITDILEREEADLVIPTQEEIEAEISQSHEIQVLTIVKGLRYTSPSMDKKLNQLNKLKRAAYKGLQVSLAQVLKEIGVKPFTLQSVEKYKKRMIFLKFFKNLPFYVFSSSLILDLSLAYIFRSNFYSSSFMAPITVILSLIALCSGVIWGMESTLRTNFEWRVEDLGWYNKDIPFFALEKIAEINMRCPAASFHVDELRNNPDPFLVVRLEETGEEYYIEVWNEPNYKQERIK